MIIQLPTLDLSTTRHCISSLRSSTTSQFRMRKENRITCQSNEQYISHYLWTKSKCIHWFLPSPNQMITSNLLTKSTTKTSNQSKRQRKKRSRKLIISRQRMIHRMNHLLNQHQLRTHQKRNSLLHQISLLK